MADPSATNPPTRAARSRPAADSTNNTSLAARWCTLLVVKASRLRPFRRRLRRRGILSLFNVCIKTDPFGNLGEAHAMEFVARHTAVPVPRVYCAFRHKGTAYTVMSRVRGRNAWRAWGALSEAARRNVAAQLRGMLAELRAVARPASEGEGGGGACGISNVDGQPYFDPRPDRRYWGPYATLRQFHHAIVGGEEAGGDLFADDDDDYANMPAELAELFRYYRGLGDDKYELVFTHGDLNCLNVMIHGDEVTGIVDWETAGWFPSYWEYTCAKDVLNPYNAWWSDEVVDHFLEPFPQELRMDRIRLKYIPF